MKNILVVGGAGYIGSYMCKYLYQNGFNPVTLDNLRTGHEQAVKWGPFIKGSLLERELLHRVFTDHSISAVMHFAARSVVWESVARPGEYYENNVSGIINLLNVMLAHDVGNIIFSSTCAVYGRAQSERMTEDHPLAPYTPYGQSKLMSEKILVDFGRAHGMHSIILRYFNAAGADPEGETGEAHSPETHLIPIVLQAALGRRDKVMVYGRDYPTKDGTCIRDFIHIHDLAAAHALGLERLLSTSPDSGPACRIYNLGTDTGHSVLEVVEAVRRVTKAEVPVSFGERRAGDEPVLVASSGKARQELGWKPQFPGIEAIIESALAWHKAHPDGYDS